MTTKLSTPRPVVRIVREPASMMAAQRPPSAPDATVERARSFSSHLFLCAECAHAVIFAEQPRAQCTRPGGAFEGRVVFAGQPGCADASPRVDDDFALAWCTPGAKKMHSRFLNVPSRAH